jgi:hypothetical protein
MCWAFEHHDKVFHSHFLTLFQLVRDNVYHRDGIYNVTKPSWNRVNKTFAAIEILTTLFYEFQILILKNP